MRSSPENAISPEVRVITLQLSCAVLRSTVSPDCAAPICARSDPGPASSQLFTILVVAANATAGVSAKAEAMHAVKHRKRGFRKAAQPFGAGFCSLLFRDSRGIITSCANAQ